MISFTRFSVSFLILLGAFSLGGCASFLDFGTAEYADEELDRGYRMSADDEEGEERAQPASVGRGLASAQDAKELGEKQFIHRAISSRDIVLGMSRDDVMRSWGEPSVREVAGNGGLGHERWTYRSRYTLQREDRIVIFENGRVAGWYR